jgi:hypothetical protein
MAQSGYTPIQIYYSPTATNVPLAANLAAGELAINTADGKLFYKDSGGVVQTLTTKGGVGSTSTTQVLYNNAGTLAGSGNMTFNGTVLTSSFAGPVAATTLSASSTVSGTGFSTYLASPPAIGGTAAAAGAFTTLSASSTVSGTGFSTYLASPPAIGGTAAAAGSFTTLTASSNFQGRINPRVSSAASAASITPTIASFDQYVLTAQAVGLTINAPTGTPVDGNKLIFRILDNGTSQTLSWNATYTVIGVTLPTATTVNKMLYVGCIYNADKTRWDVVAVNTQA